MTNHRPLQALAAALAVVSVSLVVAAPSASADGPHCRHDRSFNACLSLDWFPPYFHGLDAHVGIDVYMAERYGREILACGPEFAASLWGDDGARGPDSSDDHIRDLDLQPGWPIADSTGIAAEFIGPGLDSSDLDEDDGDDQIYARVSFYDCYGQRRDFTTAYFADSY
jgi:hypothetical protein